MSEYKIPGVYIEEQSAFPPSVSASATAVPAFLGYTARAVAKPQRIQSLMEFETLFGLPPQASGPKVTVSEDGSGEPTVEFGVALPYHLYYCVEHYFRNGGGPCWVISVGEAGDALPADADAYLAAIDQLKKLDEPTLVVLSDAMLTLAKDTGTYGQRHARYFSVLQAALAQCNSLKDRFVIADVPMAESNLHTELPEFRDAVTGHANYAAAYYPFLQTTLSRRPVFTLMTRAWRDNANNYSGFFATRNKLPIVSYSGDGTPAVEVVVNETNDVAASFTLASNGSTRILRLHLRTGERYTPVQFLDAFNALASKGGFSLRPNPLVATPNDYDAANILQPSLSLSDMEGDVAALKASHPALYRKIADRIAKESLTLPPAAAMAGIYASVDRDRGVWKAPANVGLSATLAPTVLLNRDEQEFLDVDEGAGKSINCIVKFTGQGVMPWGARTLDAGSLDWRYISVRRLFIMVEEAVRKAAKFAVFEANDKNTWSKVKAMINNYLYGLWQQGALSGGKPEEAYFVQVGLGETMSFQDVLDGRMLVQVGMAPVRPAEFIILQFSQMQQTS